MRGERILSLDFLKAVSIIAVILGHIASPFGHFIFARHIPAFSLHLDFCCGRNRRKIDRRRYSEKIIFLLALYYDIEVWWMTFMRS